MTFSQTAYTVAGLVRSPDRYLNAAVKAAAIRLAMQTLGKQQRVIASQSRKGELASIKLLYFKLDNIMPTKIIMFSISCLMMTAVSMSTANAGPRTGKLQVKINIGAGGFCELTNNADSVLDFGTHSNLDAAISDGKSTPGSDIEVKCAKGTDYKISLDGGANADSNNAGKRYMKGDKGSVEYALYQDADLKKPWGIINWKIQS